MHSSAAVETPPLLSTPPVLGQGRMSPRPVEVSMTPLPLRSTHWNASLRPMCTTEPLLPSNSARLVTQTLPSRSTAVRDGSAPPPAGAVRYSPRLLPVTASIFSAVFRPDLVTQTTGQGS